MPKKNDGLLIVLILLLAVAMLGVSKVMPKTDLSQRTADATLAPDAVQILETPEPEATPEVKTTAEAEAKNSAVGPMPPKQTEKVKGYVVIGINGRQYGDPIPMDRDKIITLRQEDGKINCVHITPETVYMESSTCDNQDCVGQGEVNVHTYQNRILQTYIICLPNAVSIEMVPVTE